MAGLMPPHQRCYVYLAITNDNKVMKIGSTMNPLKRFWGLCAESRRKFGCYMHLLRVVRGTRQLEDELLAKFRHLRAPSLIGKYEWFLPSEEIKMEFARRISVPWRTIRLCSHGVYSCDCLENLERQIRERGHFNVDLNAAVVARAAGRASGAARQAKARAEKESA